MPRPTPHTRADYPWFVTLPTRWADNDIYGHVNNSQYNFLVDTAVNRYLIDKGLIDIHAHELIGLDVETGMQFFAPITFPEDVHAGLRVARIGTTSVRYEVGLFTEANGESACAQGHFVHVYVDGVTRRPRPLPDRWRNALEEIRI